MDMLRPEMDTPKEKSSTTFSPFHNGIITPSSLLNTVRWWRVAVTADNGFDYVTLLNTGCLQGVS